VRRLASAGSAQINCAPPHALIRVVASRSAADGEVEARLAELCEERPFVARRRWAPSCQSSGTLATCRQHSSRGRHPGEAPAGTRRSRAPLAGSASSRSRPLAGSTTRARGLRADRDGPLDTTGEAHRPASPNLAGRRPHGAGHTRAQRSAGPDELARVLREDHDALRGPPRPTRSRSSQVAQQALHVSRSFEHNCTVSPTRNSNECLVALTLFARRGRY